MALNGFSVNPNWKTILEDSSFTAIGLETTDLQCQILFSLLVHFNLSIRHFVSFLFDSELPAVKMRAGAVMSTKGNRIDSFLPPILFELWQQNFPASRSSLDQLVILPRAKEIVLAESNKIINGPSLSMKSTQCTTDYIFDALKPGHFATLYNSLAPFTWDLLLTFTTSPNRYRKYHFKGKTNSNDKGENILEDDWLEDGDYQSPGPEQFYSETGTDWFKQGFTRNPTFTLVFIISMMAFTRNTSTNLFPLIMGLFLEIGGTSSRILSTLSNAGVCISINSIERLKKILSEDAKKSAVELIKSNSTQEFLIFDNINLYLRKSQQRLFNKNTMIHATNAAVISLPNSKILDGSDLDKKLKNRGNRVRATGRDIRPTPEDEGKMYTSFEGLVIYMLLSYCPGNQEWDDRASIRKLAEQKMARDRPLPIRKTDTRPLGAFDVNEGSKKGIIDMIKQLQETSELTEEEWSSKVRIIGGDWLTASNFRSARRDRSGDINTMERMEYVEDISQLFHFALNASHMLMRLHFGNSLLDPGSLAKHKGLLNRTWDAAKPNYADGKALVRHSLIARILYSLMIDLKVNFHSKLASWKPTLQAIEEFAHRFVQNFATIRRAAEAKAIDDDYLAHSIYFIRDALLFCEFEHAVSHADAGRVLRVLKYWAFSFRGAGLHNYARECIEVLIRWEYELDNDLRRALEESWFVNRWGLPGRWIAADLYLEQLNYWVKRVFIAKGSGVTIEYIIEKGSACVEVFRKLSHEFSRTFGHADRARQHREVKIDDDLRLLSEDMLKARLHVKTPNRPIKTTAKVNRKGRVTAPATSSIFDACDAGAQILQSGKFTEFLCTTTWDPALGYTALMDDTQKDPNVLLNGTAYDMDKSNPITGDSFNDIDDGDDFILSYPGLGSLGGGGEFI
ncbi:hypothetical protein BJ912DRAFT_857190 [Pholiota molesta]|nr:hypothetical protein BJ912DRAFT_857190 [Pholiota molesta]